MVKFNNPIVWLSCASAFAQVVPTTVRLTDEIAPPGGMAQVKVLLTSPKPITTGNMWMDFSSGFYDSIDGISLFSPTGDVVGAALFDSGHLNVRYTSPNGTFGTYTDYPLMTIAARLSKSVVPGQQFAVNLDPNASIWRDLLGANYAIEVKQGSVTVGGSVSITDVVPGGGTLPAGATFSVFGIGFTSNTKLTVSSSLKTDKIQFISPTEIRVTLKTAGTLDGTEFIAENPDKSSDSYFSYMRGVPQGVSTHALMARTVPVFSILTATEAVLPSTISPTLNPDYFTGLALQNPSLATAQVTIEARSGAGDLLVSTSISLPNHMKFTRELSELFGFVMPTGAYLRVVSTQPVQVMGVLGSESTKSILPLKATIIAGPPPPPPPPTTTVSGKGGGNKGTGPL